MKKTALLHIYSALMRAAQLFLPLYLRRRVRAGKEDPARLSERYGSASRPRPDGPLIWIHGASVGETLMALPIINWMKLQNKAAQVLVTSGTKTSADMLADRLPAGAFHQYLPADTPAYAARFMAHWQPDLCLWLESDLWPHLIAAAQSSGADMVLLNARLSEKSRKSWLKRRQSAKAILSAFDEILIADSATAAALSKILGQDHAAFGNLKQAAPPLPASPQEVKRIKDHLGDHNIWCAASTHSGEDTIILKAHQSVLKQCPEARLILAPRHPERADEIAAQIEAAGFGYSRWGAPLGKGGSVYLLDRMGKLGPAFTLSNIVLMGGSLLPHLKGHNPLEPAHMDCQILSGPYVASFQNIYDDMQAKKTVHILDAVTPDALAKQVINGFKDENHRAAYAQSAQDYSAAQQDIMRRLTARLTPFISRITQL